MADYQIWASTEQQLATYASGIARQTRRGALLGPKGFPTEGFLTDGTRFSMYYYKTKMVPTGNTIDDGFGNQVPEMTPAPGVYAIMRWLSRVGTRPPLDPNVTIVALPSDSPYGFAG